MTIRESIEQWEKEYLSPYACLSMDSKGRARVEQECDIRPVFQRDRDRIIHSKAFRRLKDKTQVFLTPEGDHYRTRLTHTLEVSQTARTIGRALKLNEELIEAIALGHDLGHTPFGHAGERALNKACPLGFEHHIQSVRMVEVLEKNGQGLNLTYEVIDGIRNHQMDTTPNTMEGKVVRLSDKIAYIHHDMDDAVRGGILKETDVPIEIREVLGASPSERLDAFIHDIITESTGINDIKQSKLVADTMKKLRDFMFENVYTNSEAKREEKKAEDMVITLYEYYMKNIDYLPDSMKKLLERDPKEQVVCDYVASMTDRYAIGRYEDIFVPKCWEN